MSRLMIGLAISVLLTACSSGDDGQNGLSSSTSTEPTKHIIAIRVQDRAKPTQRQQRFHAEFMEFDTPQDRPALVEKIEDAFALSEDVCNGEPREVDLEVVPKNIIVGDTVVFSNATGTYATAPLQQEDDVYYYEYGFNATTEHTPYGLLVDTEDGGVVAPLFSHPFLDIKPMAMTSPSGVPATTETEFRWEAGNGQFLNFYFFNEEGSISCELVDDGVFSIPESAKSAFATAGLAGEFDIARTSLQMHDRDDTLIVDIRISAFGDYEFFADR